jgi:hypothetical protein
MKRLLFFLFSILTIITGCEKDVDAEQLNSGSLKIDFTKLPRSSPHSITIEGITFTTLTDSSVFVNGIPTGEPPRPPIDCDKLDDNYGSFSINNCCNPADGFPPEGLSTGPLRILGVDLSKFTKIDSIRVIGRDNFGTSFLLVCNSTSKKAHTLFYGYGIDRSYTRTIKIGMELNTLLYHSTFGSIYSIEVFHK